MSLRENFNKESIDPTEAPILVGVRTHDNGTKQYVVHQYNGWFSGDSIETYGEEAFKEKFGDEKMATLSDFKAQYDDVQSQRHKKLEEAGELIEKHTNIDVSAYGVKSTNALQRELNGHIQEIFEYGIWNGDDFDKAKKLVEEAGEVGYEEAKPMRLRLERIEGDLKDAGEPMPKIENAAAMSFSH